MWPRFLLSPTITITHSSQMLSQQVDFVKVVWNGRKVVVQRKHKWSLPQKSVHQKGLKRLKTDLGQDSTLFNTLDSENILDTGGTQYEANWTAESKVKEKGKVRFQQMNMDILNCKPDNNLESEWSNEGMVDLQRWIPASNSCQRCSVFNVLWHMPVHHWSFVQVSRLPPFSCGLSPLLFIRSPQATLS